MDFDYMQAIEQRHSVRRYTAEPIPAEAIERLNMEISACNSESGLSIQLITEEPQAFGGFMAHYGKITGVRNYIALVGRKGERLDETAGYYGERIVLLAQSLGLNTCWVALTYSKGKCRAKVARGEKIACVIAIGRGETQGVQHRSKPFETVCSAENMPDWFRRGVEAALLAPTAVNQQAFRFTLIGKSTVLAEAGRGPYARMDLGIVKLHFELAAGKQNFTWAE